jgi:hypothetical protein
MIIYADKGLMNRSHVRTAFRGNNLVEWQQHENDAMKRPRGVSSEMPFGEVLSESKYITFKQGMKIQLIAVYQIYIVAIILHNAHVCLYGSKVSEYFEAEPPKLYDYMRCVQRGIPYFDY